MHNQPAITDAVMRVLESMYFTSIVESVDLEQSVALSSDWFASTLRFEGAGDGRFGLAVSPEAARALAGNFLGVDGDELTVQQQKEVVGELTNMVAGLLLSDQKSDRSLTLSPPAEQSPSTFEKEYQNTKGQSFVLEDGTLSIWFDRQS